ncbi:hypothetical protein ACFYW6_10830 [Streptomyces sp. NPDC002659]|uniref:hypothetical protein n=1 Tax=Streptomyces sp. NPDC002659 TaxID=3364656 RepID=UPI00369F3C69
MVQPRFLYVVRASQQRPDGEEKPVGWRLVGANNRELGRSADAFGGLAECQAAVAQLREKVAAARVLLTMGDAAGSWTWRLEIDGQAVAVSGRRYLRQRECQYNLSQFLVAVPVALLAVGVTSRPRPRALPPRGPQRSRSTRAEQEDEGHARPHTGVRAGTGAR